MDKKMLSDFIPVTTVHGRIFFISKTELDKILWNWQTGSTRSSNGITVSIEDDDSSSKLYAKIPNGNRDEGGIEEIALVDGTIADTLLIRTHITATLKDGSSILIDESIVSSFADALKILQVKPESIFIMTHTKEDIEIVKINGLPSAEFFKQRLFKAK